MNRESYLEQQLYLVVFIIHDPRSSQMSISGNVSCSGNQHMIARECDSAHVQPQGRLCLRLLYQLIYISCSEKRRLGAGNLSTVSASSSESAGFRSPLPEYSSIVRAHFATQVCITPFNISHYLRFSLNTTSNLSLYSPVLYGAQTHYAFLLQLLYQYVV